MTYEEQYQRDLLYFKMNLLQAEIEMHSMLCQNKQDELSGRQTSFNPSDFDNLVNKHGIHHNAFPHNY